jgi:hypothetical protein
MCVFFRHVDFKQFVPTFVDGFYHALLAGHDLTPLKEYLMIDFPRESSSKVKEKVRIHV